MRELCLMPWLRVTAQRTPKGVPLYPQTLHPVTIHTAAGGEMCPENRTENDENPGKTTVFLVEYK